MKLVLKKGKAKNFLSIGSKPVEIDYTPGIHGVIGKVVGQDTTNGVGKSTIFQDLIVFAFYGKSIRGTNKKEIINTINEKECEVELEFSINNKNYKIERGLNPDYFRFIDVDLPEAEQKEKSAKKETQQSLIDMMPTSYTGFINTITLNINYSKPFFKLEKAEKRQILEDVMNLSIYGKMFEKIKKEYNLFKTENRVLEAEVNAKEELYTEKKSTFETVENMRKEFEMSKQTKIDSLKQKIIKYEEKLSELNGKLPAKNFKEIKIKLEEIKEKISDKNSDITYSIKHLISKNESLKEEIEDLKNNPVCPRCKTVVAESNHTTDHISSLAAHIEKNIKEINELKDKKEKIVLKLEEIKEKLEKINTTIEKVNKLNSFIKECTENIFNFKSQLETENLKEFNSGKLTKKEDVDKALLILEVKKNEWIENDKNMKYADHLKEILGDNGIKKYIIKKIIPLLNKKINQYLSMLKANYTISFDSELNEVFKSRNREERSYGSFSAGEQKRIDLAVMFALLYIAKAQSSIDCNMLILDEILDSSMCSSGIMHLMNYLKTDFKTEYPNMCVYIISHKSEISEDNFNTLITIKKENEFSKIESIKEIDQIIQV